MKEPIDTKPGERVATHPDAHTLYVRVSLQVMTDLLKELKGTSSGDVLMIELLGRLEKAFFRLFPNSGPQGVEAFKGTLWRMVVNAGGIVHEVNTQNLQARVSSVEAPLGYGLTAPRRKSWRDKR